MKATNYAIDQAFSSVPKILIPARLWLLRVFSWIMAVTRILHRWDKDIRVATHHLQGPDGNRLKVLEVSPKNLSGASPAIIYYHGGGFFLTYGPLHLKHIQIYARSLNAKVFLVAYRLSTKAPFPAALKDCIGGLEWVHDNAEQLQIDRQRLMVMGDSAGGCLAAGVTQWACDQRREGDVNNNNNGPHKIDIRAQALVYPATDCETKTVSASQFTDTPIWNSHNNRIMWNIYLRGSDYKAEQDVNLIPAYASPIHRHDFSQLPPAYIENAEFDPLRDEAQDYANALEKNGVKVIMQTVKGAIHGFDGVDCDVTRDAISIRINAMKELLESN